MSGGYLVVATIEVADGLQGSQRDRALRLGPGDVDAEASLRSMVEGVDFDVAHERDVTSDFRTSIVRRLDALVRHEAALRRAEGDEAVDGEREKRSRMLTGVDEGLLRRTVVVGRAR
jgi:hypothetical protein